ncbi:MAG TPA: hypothetical protein VF704_02845 [Allosphingosinicella sp.]|jgi:hypothetical protein
MLSKDQAAYRKLLSGDLGFGGDVREIAHPPLQGGTADDVRMDQTQRPDHCGTVKTNDCTCYPQCPREHQMERVDRLA